MLLQQVLLATTALALALPTSLPTTAPTALINRSPEQPTKAAEPSNTADAAASGYLITTDRIIVDGVTKSHVTIPAKTIDVTRLTCKQTAVPDENGHVPPGSCGAIWDYYPSFAAAIAFIIAFSALMGLHIWQAARYKKIWCWVVIMSTIWETSAFVFRALSSKHQQNRGIYLVFQIFILLAPLWVNAFAYMTLGRMVYYFLPSRSILHIPAATLAAVFVALDIISFIVQLVGGSLAGPGSPLDQQQKAIHIYMGGIGLQEFFIVVFVGLAVVFQREMMKLGRTSWGSPSFFKTEWGPLLFALYFSLAMITVRIVYRLVEFSGGMGQDNALTTHEAYFYALEAVPMFLALVAFNIVHPGRVMIGPNSHMPGLFTILRGSFTKQGKQLLDQDDGSSDHELNPRWMSQRASAN